MAIQRQLGHLAQAFHHRRPNRNVGHKMAVHHVHVDHRAAATLGRGNLVRQVGEIRRKNRWKQLNHDFWMLLLAGSVYQREAYESFGSLPSTSLGPAPLQAACGNSPHTAQHRLHRPVAFDVRKEDFAAALCLGR